MRYSSPVPWMCFRGCLHYSAKIRELAATKTDLPVCLPLCIAAAHSWSYKFCILSLLYKHPQTVLFSPYPKSAVVMFPIHSVTRG